MQKSLILILSIFLWFSWAGPAAAQQDIRFETLEIDLWPEYDRPSMLVIYRAILNTRVQLPVELTLRIPAATASLNAVAVRDMSTGSLFSVAYNREVRGEWAYITFSTTMPDIQVEFYDEIQFADDRRIYQFQWGGDYAVDDLSLVVQQPLDTLEMLTTPRLSQIEENGFVFHTAQIGGLRAGEMFDLSIQYQKSSSRLTAESLTVQSATPIQVNTSGFPDAAALVPWGMAFLGVMILAGGIYWYWASGNNKSSAERARQPAANGRKNRVEPEMYKDPDENGVVYCHNCGKRGGGSDRFCRSCGARFRQSS